MCDAADLAEYTPGPGAAGAAREVCERADHRLAASNGRSVARWLQLKRELETVLAVWRAVANAGAYADVATALAGELAGELTPERAEELILTLEKLDEAVGTALVVVRAELRDQLNPAQLQIPLQSEVG